MSTHNIRVHDKIRQVPEIIFGLNIFYYIIQVQESNKYDIQTI